MWPTRQFGPWEKWKFAICQCLEKIHRNRQRRNWSYVLQRAKSNVLYVQYYVDHLLNPTATISSELKNHKDEMEKDLEVDELLSLQAIAMKKASEKTKDQRINAIGSLAVLLTLLPNWKEWHLVPNDIVMNFKVSRGVIALTWTSHEKRQTPTVPRKAKLMFEFEDTSAKYTLSPQAEAKLLHVKLGSLTLLDTTAEHQINRVLISPLAKKESSQAFQDYSDDLKSFNDAEVNENPLLQIILETNPKSMAADVRLVVKSRPLKIVFSAVVIQELCNFFIKPHREYKLAESIKRFYENFIQVLAYERWDINLDISAPKIVFPGDSGDANSISVICNLGELHCDTEYLGSTSGNSPNLQGDQDAVSTGDKYFLQLHNLQVYVTHRTEEYEAQDMQGQRFLDNFTAWFHIERERLHGTNSLKPKISIRGILPKLSFLMNGRNIRALSTCFGQIGLQAIVQSIQSFMHNPAKLQEDLKSDSRLLGNGTEIQDACLKSASHGTEVATIANKNSNNVKWLSVELQVAQICIHLTDDDQRIEIPILVVNIGDLNLHQKVGDSISGNCQLSLSIDFYNQSPSGWEPLVEPWTCTAISEFSKTNTPPLSIIINGEDVLNMNLTSAVIDVYCKMRTKWTKDYFKQVFFGRESDEVKEVYSKTLSKSVFVHYGVKNLTGCEIALYSADSDQRRISRQGMDIEKGLSVSPDEEAEFELEWEENVREMKNQKIIICIKGWNPTSHLTVNHVGHFFRDIKSSSGNSSTKLLVSIELERSGRKLITIQSGLVLKNELNMALELQVGDEAVLHLDKQASFPVPLDHINKKLSFRPSEISDIYYSQPLQWQSVKNPGDTQEILHSCASSIPHSKESFQFFAHIKRLQCLMDVNVQNRPNGVGTGTNDPSTPLHIVTFVPPVILINLLPCSLKYEVTECKNAQGIINSRNKEALYYVNTPSSIKVTFTMVNFTVQENLVIPKESSSFEKQLPVQDTNGRMLVLRVKVVGQSPGCSRKVHISAPYWFINKTGLPIIHGVDSLQPIAAGQFSEHEMASSATPMMFSFTDRFAPERCKLRIGTKLHPGSTPEWCNTIKLSPGVKFVDLRVLQPGSSPWIYSIGIEIHEDHYPESNTRVVTLTTQFELHNYSSHCLEYIQKYLLGQGYTPKTIIERQLLRAVPNCILPFHWLRKDRPQLLCVRAPNVSENWSCGFPIYKVRSCHINIRRVDGTPLLLRAEITLQGATYHVVFTDADDVPPPLRLENMSEVPITFKQYGLPDNFEICVMPQTSIKYCWDDTIHVCEMVCTAPGGLQNTFSLSPLTNNKNFLSYENMVYIEFTATFESSDNEGLVLDVNEDGHVILNHKNTKLKTQLWKPLSDGKLEHVHSSVMETAKSGTQKHMVLDASNLSIVYPNDSVSLKICKTNYYSETMTQTWDFTTDGRLQCKVPYYYIQPKGGIQGLKPGTEVIVNKTINYAVPKEQLIHQKPLPGSGRLGGYVTRDGPTYVLQVFDGLYESNIQAEASSGMPTSYCQEYFQLTVNMPKGIGLSLVNHVPEELIYAGFKDIYISYKKSPKEHSLKGRILDFQIDNQLPNSRCPQILQSPHLVPESPAIYFEMTCIPSQHPNVEIFKKLIIALNDIVLTLEEPLIWKLRQAFGYGKENEDDLEAIDNSSSMITRLHRVTSSALAKQFYFDNLKFVLRKVVFNIITCDHLSPELEAIKLQSGYGGCMPYLSDTILTFTPFVRFNTYESSSLFGSAIAAHYRIQIWKHAGKIFNANISSRPTVASGLTLLKTDKRSQTADNTDSATPNFGSLRLRRVCRDAEALLPIYSYVDSNGQQLLLQLNDQSRFVAIEYLTSSKNGLWALISTTTVYFINSLKSGLNTNPCILTLNITAASQFEVGEEYDGNKVVYFLKLRTGQVPTSTGHQYGLTAAGYYKLPCDSKATAQKVLQHLHYAKELQEEILQVVVMD